MQHNARYRRYTVMVLASADPINLITNCNAIFSNHLLSSPLNRTGYLRRTSAPSQVSPLEVLDNPWTCPTSRPSNRVHALAVTRKGISFTTALRRINRCIQWLLSGHLWNDMVGLMFSPNLPKRHWLVMTRNRKALRK